MARGWSDFLRIIAQATLLLVVESTPEPNPCGDRAGVKTWGSGCTNLCRCLNSTGCHYDGHCPAGCAPGYTPRTPGGPCSNPIEDERSIQLRAAPDESNTDAESTLSNTHKYVFIPAGKCIHTSRNTTLKKWPVKSKIHLLIHRIYIHIVSGKGSIIHFYVTLQGGDKHEEKTSRKVIFVDVLKSKIFSLPTGQSIVFDAVTLETETQNCSDVNIGAVFIHGVPVCDYRKWGTNCDKMCPCPCQVKDCHPISGECDMPGFSCPSGKHGPSCQKNCSHSCSGNPRECHVISGVCKQCSDLNHTGVECETELSGEELELRSTACDDSTDSFGQVPASNRRHVRRTERNARLPDGIDNQRHSSTSYMFIAAVVVVVVAFLFACSIYVMIIRHCIREKRKKLEEIEKERIRRISMMSYTELQGEYNERAANSDVHSLGVNRAKSHSGPSERSRHSSVKSEKERAANSDVHNLGVNRAKSHSGPSERSRHSSVKSEKVKPVPILKDIPDISGGKPFTTIHF